MITKHYSELKSMAVDNVVTICGSTKFKAEFENANKQLTSNGIIVLTVGWFGHSDVEFPKPELKARLDLLHKRKILMSDAIVVVNCGGYVGDSTASEIAYAESLNIPVYYLYDECGYKGNQYFEKIARDIVGLK